MFSENQINTMVRMQNEMNQLVHPEWKDQNFPYLRAARMEAMEAIDHYGWKFWKKQTPDMDQVRLEVVDIWHFLLSHLILEQKKGGFDLYSHVVITEFKFNDLCFVCECEDFIKSTLEEFSYVEDILVFFSNIKTSINMSDDELFKLYLAKNTLNKFRQAHGYKEGTYIKNWQGREDNEHLTEIMKELDLDQPDVELVINRAIAERYNRLSI